MVQYTIDSGFAKWGGRVPRPHPTAAAGLGMQDIRSDLGAVLHFVVRADSSAAMGIAKREVV
jgi:hypothetical protein